VQKKLAYAIRTHLDDGHVGLGIGATGSSRDTLVLLWGGASGVSMRPKFSVWSDHGPSSSFSYTDEITTRDNKMVRLVTSAPYRQLWGPDLLPQRSFSQAALRLLVTRCRV
jgi:hypothetical protein